MRFYKQREFKKLIGQYGNTILKFLQNFQLVKNGLATLSIISKIQSLIR